MDLIVAGQPLPDGVIAVILQALFRRPSYIFHHGCDLQMPMSSMRRRLGSWFMSRSTGIVAVSEFSRNLVIKLGVRKDNIHVLKLGTNPIRFKPDLDSSAVIQRYRLEDKRVLLTVARLQEGKGHDMVIKCLPMILERHPNTIYMIVGKGDNASHLRNLVSELGLEDKVIFTGYVPDEGITGVLCSL